MTPFEIHDKLGKMKALTSFGVSPHLFFNCLSVLGCEERTSTTFSCPNLQAICNGDSQLCCKRKAH